MDQNEWRPMNGGMTPAVTFNQYLARTFGWMFAGMTVTFAVAAALCLTDAAYMLAASPAVVLAVTVAELVVVIAFSVSLLKRPVGVTKALFFTYAVLNGLVFSMYFLIFDMTSLITVFALTALFFGFFALYGMRTQSDLGRLRPILFGGLVALLLMGLVSALFRFSGMETLICFGGIALFVAFTAYDVQMIKRNYAYFAENGELLEKASIYSALQLYLDFINLFLHLLQLLGRAKSDN